MCVCYRETNTNHTFRKLLISTILQSTCRLCSSTIIFVQAERIEVLRSRLKQQNCICIIWREHCRQCDFSIRWPVLHHPHTSAERISCNCSLLFPLSYFNRRRSMILASCAFFLARSFAVTRLLLLFSVFSHCSTDASIRARILKEIIYR